MAGTASVVLRRAAGCGEPHPRNRDSRHPENIHDWDLNCCQSVREEHAPGKRIMVLILGGVVITVIIPAIVLLFSEVDYHVPPRTEHKRGFFRP